MKKLRRVTEAEVIAEFLKSEFFHHDYDFDRDLFTEIVHRPDLTSDVENALRRALFYRRRGAMWWEIPENRQWWEIELEPADLDRISIFPRAHWVKLSLGDFSVRNVAERVRRRMQNAANDPFVAKMAGISAGMKAGAQMGLVIFLGVDEHRQVTVLEGNHRFIASLLGAENKQFSTLRAVAGFSPDMWKCCWYKTNFWTLCRCLKNRIQHYWDRDADVAALLDQIAQARTAKGYIDGTAPVKPKVIS